MENIYEKGSVWRISFIKVESGKGDQYLREIGPLRKKLMEEAINEGIVLSYKTLNGLSMGKDDWDFMFMVEYSNWAAIDGLQSRLDELNRRYVGGEEVLTELVSQRSNVRQVIGEKFMQELHFS